MTMYDYVWLFMTMFDYVWRCLFMYAYVWLCMTMHDFAWEGERERERERANFKTFSSFCKPFQNIKIFKQFNLFYMIQTFLNFSCFSTNLDFIYLCLPLFTFVYLCLPLFTFVDLCLHLFTFVYLCSTDASMHKFCACLGHLHVWGRLQFWDCLFF